MGRAPNKFTTACPDYPNVKVLDAMFTTGGGIDSLLLPKF
ncbi:2637_t:CDS:2 [Funneliformis caledonium]|uniref:2637_t:CDS:1 n=1 Tax=Funneliformis caledonium TaxID=1117310 RepID=A0A9N8V0M5_9GLOM|nr:2637_t:CDS:2 [Funneliformis caledonium]